MNKTKKIAILILSRKRFKTKNLVRRWLKENKYKELRYLKTPIKKDGKNYIVIQRQTYKFNKKTLRLKPIGKHVKGIYGYLK